MVNSVQKAFRVLTVFNSTEPRLTLTQIVDKLGVDKSTAQRFTHTLQVLGYLDKNPVSKTLGVTVKMVDLAHAYLSSNPLIAAAMPYMVHLNRETGETQAPDPLVRGRRAQIGPLRQLHVGGLAVALEQAQQLAIHIVHGPNVATRAAALTSECSV